MSEEVDLSRRTVLGVLGTTGVAALGAGFGTTSYLSDSEVARANSLTAGRLDLKVAWAQFYDPDGGSEVPVNAAPDENGDRRQDPLLTRSEIADRQFGRPLSALADAERAAVDEIFREQFADDANPPLIAPGRLEDAVVAGNAGVTRPDGYIQPGDAGRVTFDVHLFESPGFVRLQGELFEDAENGLTDGETGNEGAIGNDGGDPDPDSGELAEELLVSAWLDPNGNGDVDDAETDGVLFEDRPLRGAFEDLSTGRGVPIDFVPATPSTVDCLENSTTRRVTFAWRLPADVGGIVETDSVTFSLGVFAEQCRHNVVEATDGDAEPALVSTSAPSWIAFGRARGGPGSVRFVYTDARDAVTVTPVESGYEIDWRTDTGVRLLAVKTGIGSRAPNTNGRGITNVLLDEPATSGRVVIPADGRPATADQTDPCPFPADLEGRSYAGKKLDLTGSFEVAAVESSSGADCTAGPPADKGGGGGGGGGSS